MLDETEFQSVTSKIAGTPIAERFNGVLAEYEKITGYHESNPSAIYHHRLSLYGPPCKRCGKPLRSPKAKLCGNCMHPA